MRARRVLKATGLVLAVALVAFVFGWVPYFLGGVVTTRRFAYNDKENAGLTPASFGLPFEEVAFPSRDGVPLRGWWVAAPQARGILMDRITCATCHLPHGRETPGAAPAITAGQRSAEKPMLRTDVSGEFCASCHGNNAPRLYLYFHRPDKRAGLAKGKGGG